MSNSLFVGGSLIGVAALANKANAQTGGIISIVNSFSALGSTAASAGDIVEVKGHTTAGIGGGNFIAKSGSVTNDGGTLINSASSNVYWQRINYDFLTPAFFGCIGTGDEVINLQKAINAAQLNPSKTLVFDKKYYIQATSLNVTNALNLVTLGDGSPDAGGVFTSSAITLLKITHDNVNIFGLKIEHQGSSGRAISIENCNAVRVRGCEIVGGAVSGTGELCYFNGSNIYFDDNRFDSFRNNHWTIVWDRTSWGININSRIDRNYFGGGAKGILVYSSDSSARPEGIQITNNDSVLLGFSQVEIQSCLSCVIKDNMLDQSSGYAIYLNPVSTAANLQINDISIEGRYISTAINAHGVSGGIGIYANAAVSGSSIGGLVIRGVSFDQCAYGINLGSNCNNVIIDSCSFSAIDQTKLSLNQSKNCIVTNCQMPTTGHAMTLIDGASGGPFLITDCAFNSAGGFTFTKTTASNFKFGNSIGRKFVGFSAGTSGLISSGTDVYIAFAHGLAATPDLDKTIVNARTMSGGFKNISCSVAAVDATNITVQVFYSLVSAGTIRITAYCEI